MFGYYIEISKTNLDKAPAEYHRKQTLANAERFITPELKEYEEKVLGAEDRLKELENELFLDRRDRAARWTPQVQQIARAIARIDVLYSLAEVAERRILHPAPSWTTASNRHPRRPPSGRRAPATHGQLRAQRRAPRH